MVGYGPIVRTPCQRKGCKGSNAYAARRSVIVVLKPRVPAKLGRNREFPDSSTHEQSKKCLTYVGKKLTKLKPNNWVTFIKHIIHTLQSVTAMYSPLSGLTSGSVSHSE